MTTNHPERGRAAILVIVAILACAVLAWLVTREVDTSSEADSARAPGTATSDTEALRTEPGSSTAEPLRTEREPAATAPRSEADAAAPPARRPTPAQSERVLQGVARIGELLASEKAEEGWERELEKLTAQLSGSVRANPALARLVREQMDATVDEDVAIRLARILRSSDDEAFLQEMAARVTEAGDPLHRRTAILVLETKDASLWYEPVTTVYTQDAEAAVRDEASFVLGRSLADRKHVQAHRKLRAKIQTELKSADPRARERALRTMMADRTAGTEDLDLVNAYLEDPDPDVRQAAASAARVLAPRVERQIERRGY